MTDGADAAENGGEQLQVAFPASPTFTRIGRVAVVGLALRLGHDEAALDRLRRAVDEAVIALQGPGRIDVRAAWTDHELTITLRNPDAEIADTSGLASALGQLVGSANAERTAVELTIDAPSP